MSPLRTNLKSSREVHLVLGWEVHRPCEEQQRLTRLVSSSDPSGGGCEREKRNICVNLCWCSWGGGGP